MVPQRQLGFLYQMLFNSVSKMVELKENEKLFSASVTIMTQAQNFLSTIWPLIEILRSLVFHSENMAYGPSVKLSRIPPSLGPATRVFDFAFLTEQPKVA